MACRPKLQVPSHFLSCSIDFVQFVSISLKNKCAKLHRKFDSTLEQYSINGLLYNVMLLNVELSQSFLELCHIANVDCDRTKLLFPAVLTVQLSVPQVYFWLWDFPCTTVCWVDSHLYSLCGSILVLTPRWAQILPTQYDLQMALIFNLACFLHRLRRFEEGQI